MADASPLKESTQDAIAEKLKADPAFNVEPVVEATIKAELAKPGASTKAILEDVCYGAMSALILADRDPCEGVVQVLRAVGHIIQTRSGDPMTTMGYALGGVAKIAAVVPPAKLADISVAIDNEFMGAGELFNQLYQNVGK